LTVVVAPPQLTAAVNGPGVLGAVTETVAAPVAPAVAVLGVPAVLIWIVSPGSQPVTLRTAVPPGVIEGVPWTVTPGASGGYAEALALKPKMAARARSAKAIFFMGDDTFQFVMVNHSDPMTTLSRT
jgi:hypothetical protein